VIFKSQLKCVVSRNGELQLIGAWNLHFERELSGPSGGCRVIVWGRALLSISIKQPTGTGAYAAATS
jgi:hypothetical protein